jgi:hypothetical protein
MGEFLMNNDEKRIDDEAWKAAGGNVSTLAFWFMAGAIIMLLLLPFFDGSLKNPSQHQTPVSATGRK